MATGRPKTDIGKEEIKEIEEILDLYIEKILHGVKSKLTYNGVKTFNDKIANSPKYLRKNGEPFKEYSRTIWSGTYQGKDYYGRKKIKEILSDNEIVVQGEEFIPDTTDLNLLFTKFKTPMKFNTKIIKIFSKERKNYAECEALSDKYKTQRDEWKLKYELLLQGVVNLMYQSQSTDNSLNNMFNMRKPVDLLCCKEFTDMFNNDEELINSLVYPNKNTELTVDNVISLHPKLQDAEFEGL